MPPLKSLVCANQSLNLQVQCLGVYVDQPVVIAVLQDDLDAPPERICGAEVPMPYAANLEAMALPTVDDIVRVARRMCGVKQ